MGFATRFFLQILYFLFKVFLILLQVLDLILQFLLLVLDLIEFLVLGLDRAGVGSNLILQLLHLLLGDGAVLG